MSLNTTPKIIIKSVVAKIKHNNDKNLPGQVFQVLEKLLFAYFWFDFSTLSFFYSHIKFLVKMWNKHTKKEYFKPLWLLSYKNIELECEIILKKRKKKLMNGENKHLCIFYKGKTRKFMKIMQHFGKEKRCDEKTLKLKSISEIYLNLLSLFCVFVSLCRSVEVPTLKTEKKKCFPV